MDTACHTIETLSPDSARAGAGGTPPAAGIAGDPHTLPWTIALGSANLTAITRAYPERAAAAWLLWTVVVHECYRRQSTTVHLARSVLADRTKGSERNIEYILSALRACRLLTWAATVDKTTGRRKVRRITITPRANEHQNAQGSPCAPEVHTSVAQTYNPPVGGGYRRKRRLPATAGAGLEAAPPCADAQAGQMVRTDWLERMESL